MKNLLPLEMILALAIGLVLAVGTHQAQAVTIATGELITNGGFGTEVAPSLTGWAVGGTANARRPQDMLDDAIGNLGFNNFFLAATGAFAALGDGVTTPNNQIIGPPDSGTHSISQAFTLLPTLNGNTISDYDLLISFRSVFDGQDSSTNNHDTFSATLNLISLFTQDSSGFPNLLPAIGNPNNQLVWNPFSDTLSGLLPGVYTLTFTLYEDANTTEGSVTRTAAGIDSVSVTGNANVVPEPSTFLLLGAGLAGIGFLRRKMKM